MSVAVDRVRAALEARGLRVQQKGSGFESQCPSHEDGRASLSVAEGSDGRALLKCHAGCDTSAIVAALGLELKDLFDGDRKEGKKKPEKQELCAYSYTDEDSNLLYQCVRFIPKDFRQRRPDGKGGWVWNLNGTRRVLYGLPRVREAIARGIPIYLTEGEKDANEVNREAGDADPRHVATCNPMGAGKWTDELTGQLVGAGTVRIWQDKDEPGQKHARAVAAALTGKVARVEIVESKIGKDAFDHIKAGHSPETAVLIQGPAEPLTLFETLAVFHRWQLMPLVNGEPDAGAVLVNLGTYAANRMAGDPLWILNVGPPGRGKTECLMPFTALHDVHLVSTMTGEASLLSGTSKGETAKDAKGGLLREIGERGVIVMKDFGSILSMNRDTRAQVLAALREVYDGAYTRIVGTDGGRTLEWRGHVGLMAACTPTVDRHHAVMSVMGERFIIYRLPDLPADALIRKALAHAGREALMRKQLAEAVRGLMETLTFPDRPTDLTEPEMVHLSALAQYVALARAPVERDGYHREIELIPGSEAPTRIAITLKRLLEGLLAIGAPNGMAWDILEKVALDCLPMIRRRTRPSTYRSPASRSTRPAISQPMNGSAYAQRRPPGSGTS